MRLGRGHPTGSDDGLVVGDVVLQWRAVVGVQESGREPGADYEVGDER